MYYDEIVEEVRKKRIEHAAKFNYDLRQIVEDLNNKQRKYKRKTVSFPPKPPRHQKIALNTSEPIRIESTLNR